MFTTARDSTWLRRLGVPTAATAHEARDSLAEWIPAGAAIGWTRGTNEVPLERYWLGSVAVHARSIAPGPPSWGSGWEPYVPLRSHNDVVAHVWRDVSGSLFLPFDPDVAIDTVLREAYLLQAPRSEQIELAKRLARRAYYRARPMMPRRSQIALRRAFSRFQQRQAFPAWPIETALHDLLDVLLAMCAEVAGEPVPWLAPWPRPFRWALVLTHDVETKVGYSRILSIQEEERARGYRSAWNLVPARDYAVEDELVDTLARAGCEVGVHGLYHDGRDLESEEKLFERLPRIREWAERWNAVGFRAPATQRDWSLMPLLGFDYDSSYPDTDPFEPQGGGCCSWLPFFNDEMVELPITLPQDHTLFVILQEPDAARWIEKARFLRDRGGMALIDTHPDYLYDEPAASAYSTFLDTFRADETAWRALPREVAAWWRRRAETRIERAADGWRAVGPAADEVAVRFASPQAANL